MDKQQILKEEIFKAQEAGDIAALYMLEADAHELFDEELLGAFYMNILDLALEKLTLTLEAHRVMDMQDVQDFATLRALYEYAIEHYSAGATHDASALFEVIAGLSRDKDFSHAATIHKIAAAQKIDFELFLQEYADIDATQKVGTFYISAFTQKAQDLLLTQNKIVEL